MSIYIPTRLLGGFVIAVVALNPASSAERRVGQRPNAGTENIVTVGSTLFERFNMVAVQIPKLREDVEVKLGIQGKISIPSNATFAISNEKPLKVCTIAEDTYIDIFVGPRGAACLTDSDMDGKFDKASAASVLFTNKSIKEPVAYDLIDTAASSNSDYFKMTLTYLGAAAGVLKLSYREFTHDMARPAFTEELSFPVDATFPQTIAWRDTTFTLLALDNKGLRYRVEATKP